LGNYYATVTDAYGASISVYAEIGYLSAWDTLIGLTEDSVGNLNLDTLYLGDRYAFSSNTIKVSEDGYVTYAVDAGSDYSGILGLSDNSDFNESASGVGVLIANGEMYVVGTGLEEQNYIGNYLNNHDYEIKISVVSDSIKIERKDNTENVVSEYDLYFPRAICLKQAIVIYVNNYGLPRIITNFNCYPPSNTNDTINYVGILSCNTDTVCKGSLVQLTLSSHSGIIQWQQKAAGNLWTNIPDSIGGQSDTVHVMGIQETSDFRVVLLGDGCNIVASNSIKVSTTLDAPDITNAITIKNASCGSIDSIELYSPNDIDSDYSFQWEYSVNGESYNTITVNSNENTYKMPSNTSGDIWYRRVVSKNKMCTKISNSVKLRL
jgi:hypothetical protein